LRELHKSKVRGKIGSRPGLWSWVGKFSPRAPLLRRWNQAFRGINAWSGPLQKISRVCLGSSLTQIDDKCGDYPPQKHIPRPGDLHSNTRAGTPSWDLGTPHHPLRSTRLVTFYSFGCFTATQKVFVGCIQTCGTGESGICHFMVTRYVKRNFQAVSS